MGERKLTAQKWSGGILEVKLSELAARRLPWIENRMGRLARIPRDALLSYTIFEILRPHTQACLAVGLGRDAPWGTVIFRGVLVSGRVDTLHRLWIVVSPCTLP